MNSAIRKFITLAVPRAKEAGQKFAEERTGQTFEEVQQRIVDFVEWAASSIALDVDMEHPYFQPCLVIAGSGSDFKLTTRIYNYRPDAWLNESIKPDGLWELLGVLFQACDTAGLKPTCWQHEAGRVHYIGIAAKGIVLQ